MNGSSAITNCSTDTGDTGGGVLVEKTGTLTMNGNSAIRDCTARTGGGVTVNRGDPAIGQFFMNGGQITMSGGTIGAGCTIFNVSSRTVFTISGGAEIGADITNGSILYADGGSVSGTVKNGYQNYSDPGTITGGGAGTTTFHGNVENISGAIEKGSFESSVTNKGTISGSEFTGTGFVTNNGTISGGTFSETKEVSNSSGGTFNGLVINSGGTITGGSCTRAQIVTFLYRSAK